MATKKKKAVKAASASGAPSKTRKTRKTRKAKSNPKSVAKRATGAIKSAARKVGKVARRRTKKNPAPGQMANIGKGVGGVLGGGALGYVGEMLGPMPAAIAGAVVSALGVGAIAIGHPIAGGVAAGAGGAVLGSAVYRYKNEAAPPVVPEAPPVAGEDDLPPGSEIIGRDGALYRINDDGSRTMVRAPRALTDQRSPARSLSVLEGSEIHRLD